MCRIAGVTKINDDNRDSVWLFMQILGEAMSVGNSDGLGYAAFDKSKKLFGERWLFNKTAFSDLSKMRGLDAKKANNIYSFFGDKVLRDEAQSIILHTRMATCGRGIQNTHPFVNDLDNPTNAIIHNGIIYNDNAFKKKFSTCDSEVLTHLYDDHDVNGDLSNLNNFTGLLEGWYTVLNLSTNKAGRMVMDLYTDNGRLSSYYIPELDVRVYSTSAQDIQQTAAYLGLSIEDLQVMEANTAQRIDVLTGEVLDECNLVDAVVESESLGNFASNVHYMEGNFDDDGFASNFFRKGWNK